MFHWILLILVSTFMVHRALSDKPYLSLELMSPLNWSIASHIKLHIIQQDVSDGDVINDVKLHLYILLQTFSIIQSDVALQKHVH